MVRVSLSSATQAEPPAPRVGQAVWPASAGRTAAPRIRLLDLGFVVIVLLYFAWFVGPGLLGGFNNDDPMNIHSFWIRGPGQLIRNLVLFFTTYGRPMGGVYFSLLYHFFGLNPLPYHVALTGLLLTNTFLAYRLGRLITGSRLAGGLTALVVTYHAQMMFLVYLPAFVFDVLCFTFYLLAFTYYVSVRQRGALLTWKQTVVFLLLYMGALDSKEMAVTLPVMVLLYEAIWHAPAHVSVAGIAHWLRVEALPGLLAGVMTLVYVLGKCFGSDSLVKMEAYRPVFSWSRYWESTTRFVNTIFYQPIENGFFSPARVVLLAGVLLYAAWRLKQRHLLLMWFFLWIAPLPITFLPGRGGACLYIPLVGWAVILASLFQSCARAAAGSRALRWMPRNLPLGLIVALGIATLWAITERESRDIPLGIRRGCQLTHSVIRQIRAVQPAVRPGSKIYVVHGPSRDWDMKFIMELVYHDRSVNVWLGEQVPLPPADIARMDYVFTFEDGRLKRLKGP